MKKYKSFLGEIDLDCEEDRYVATIKFGRYVPKFFNGQVVTFVETNKEGDALKILRRDSDPNIRAIANSVSGWRRIFNPLVYFGNIIESFVSIFDEF